MLQHRYRLRTFYIGLLLTMLFGACKKSFIDDNTPTNSGSAADVFASSGNVRTYFNGIYRAMRSQWQSTDASAGGSTDAWGYNSVQLARDVKGKDITMPRNNWYFYDYQNDNREPTYRRVRFTWYFFYELINQVNVLIDGTQKSETISDDEKKPLIAEARALRAYYYFELVREFQLSYGKDPNAPGVPVYTTPATDTTAGRPRGTLQQVYDQINADIEYAVANIGSTRGMKDQVNINVAWGMAARIYLEQGQWEKAANAAQNAISGYALDADNYKDNYPNGTSPEVIWSLPQTTSNGGQSLYYGTPSSFFDLTGSGYDAFYMSVELVNQFSATDARFTFIQTGDDDTQPDYVGTNKFGTNTTDSVPLMNGDIVLLKTIDFNESLNLMRVGEMYLIVAEALARNHEEGDAATWLFNLQKNRDPNATASGNTGQALIDEILLERRKELYGEMGVDWLDAKRLQLPIDRSTSNHAAPNNYVIPANDPAFNLKIPQAEMQANKSLKPGDQNP